MKKIIMFMLTVLIISGSVLASSAAKIEGVPKGGHILVNGIFEDIEWKDALTKKLDDNMDVLLKQDSQYIYIGIRFKRIKHTGIDFYLSDSKGNRVMLHISSALANSSWDGSKWSESQWGKNNLWTGNVITLYMADGKRQIVEPGGFEFQIDKKILPGTSWSLMMHLKRPEKIYPAKAADNDIAHWLPLKN